VTRARIQPQKPSSKEDSSQPEIWFQEGLKERVIHENPLRLLGRVRDQAGLESIVIDGQTRPAYGGKNLYFSHHNVINKGEKQIQITALSRSGEQEKKQIKAKKVTLSIHQPKSRMEVAILPLSCTVETEGCPAKEAIEEVLLARLMDGKRFKMIERQYLLDVLTEQKLSASGLVGKSDTIKIGKLLAAHGLLMGTINQRRDSLEIFIRLVDAETSEILAVADSYSEQPGLHRVVDLSQRLATRLAEEWPMAEGWVIEARDDGEVVTDLNMKHGIKAGARIIIYSVGKPIRRPGSGKIRSFRVHIHGRASIQNVLEEVSFGILQERNNAKTIKPIQRVITR
jgi:TolB-like protein